MLPSAFYYPDGENFVATELTIGPWSPALQHGGPPSALMARAVAGFGDDAAAFALTRLSVDFLRPIPVGPVRVAVEVVRAGQKAQRHRARLLAGDVELAVATTLRVRRPSSPAGLALPPALSHPEWTPPPPADCAPHDFAFFPAPIAYHSGVDLRWIRGQWGRGPAAVWFRVKFPLVDGQPLTPLERAIVVADAANGVSPVLPLGGFTFMNADLSVHLYRQPAGEWLALDARSYADAAGTGLVDATLYDESGLCTRVAESLVIDKPGQ